ncbi:MAG: polyprenol phosphomannose-dependent alpha 1,6 mannosyltransferase MptB, partial [Nitrososphaerales archaeon]
MRIVIPWGPHERTGLSSGNSRFHDWRQVYRLTVPTTGAVLTDLGRKTAHNVLPGGRRNFHPRSWSLPVLGVTGALGSCCVLIGVLQPGSPFVSHASTAWLFSSSAASLSRGESIRQFLGVMLVYLGIALLLGSWLEALRAVRLGKPREVRRLIPLLVAWAAPLLFAPPLFSRDVYSYAAQGEMLSKGINPYFHGPSVLGSSTFVKAVDPLWLHATAPYGPVWERLSQWVVEMSGHSAVTSVFGFRLIALAGVTFVAWGAPELARSIGRDRGATFVLTVLNPVVLLVLLGGCHNDVLMLGLLVTALVMASRRYLILGLICCALAAEVKAPAIVAAAFIGWTWSNRSTLRQRVARTSAALASTIAVMTLVGVACRLGWRWVADLFGAGTVV